ncbi:MAG: sigma-54-dependent Fis family transcriptional regulator [Deltaproteobacteria bacterium]|nr:sigma-54-dependent Fis family transcriptional regulator [Deltaproteobacteria bacterium]MCB9788682.1 sigma-54-dependent Fis family transcriptional regulator [Deltaproteobacteria bacterium]
MTTTHATTKRATVAIDGRSDPPQPLLVLLYTAEHARIGQRAPLTDGLELGRESRHFARTPFDGDGQMSRNHVGFTARGGEVQVLDRGSTNGTFVNGRRVDSSALRLGDVLQIGGSFFQYIVANRDPYFDAASLLVGNSPEIEALRRAVSVVAPANTPVLVTGEPGTGKRTVGRELHRLSGRAGPLVVVECSGAASEAVEREIFEGSALQRARGGTLILADVDQLSPRAQLRLILALNEMGRGFEQAHDRTARLLATTRHPLREDVSAGRFREDLFARLVAWAVEISPLRHRPLDIGTLLAHYLDRFAPRGAPHAPEVQGELVWALLGHAWTHNVPQLSTVVETATVESGEQGGVVGLTPRVRTLLSSETFGPPTPPPSPHADAARHRRADDKRPPPEDRWQLVDALRQHDFVVSNVARHYGKHRQQIYRWIRQFDVDVEALRAASERGERG